MSARFQIELGQVRRGVRAALLVLLGIGLLAGAGCLGPGQGGAGEAGEKRNPGSFDAILLRGRAALEDGLYDIALRELDRAVRVTGTNRSASQAGAVVPLYFRALQGQGRRAEWLALAEAPPAWMRQAVDDGTLTFWRALGLHENGESEAAVAALANYESTYPTSPYLGQVERVRAWALLRLGQIDEADAAFNRFDIGYGATVDGPANLLDWGQALALTGRVAAAEGVLGRLTNRPAALPAVQQGRYLLGQLRAARGQAEGAIATFTELAADPLTREDLQVDAWLAISAVHRQGTNVEAAVAACSKAVEVARAPEASRRARRELGLLLLDEGRLPEGVPVLKKLISEAPEDPLAGDLQLAVAGKLLDQGMVREAAAEYQQYLEAFTNQAGRAEAFAGRGWSLSRIGRHAEAATAFEKAVAEEPDPVRRQEYLFKVGDSYFANGQFQLAMETYERLVTAYPDSERVPQALFQRAESLSRHNDGAGAIEAFQQLATAHPASREAEEALLRVAELKRQKGLPEEAIADFNHLMQTYTNGLFGAEALLERGLTYYDLFRTEEALADFERVVTAHPEGQAVEQAFYMRAMCHYRMWRDDEAFTIARTFLHRYPDSRWRSEVLFWIGRNEFNVGQYEAAERDFMEFVALYRRDPRVDDALLLAGLAAAKRKEYGVAMQHFAQLVKEYPDSDKIPETRFAQADALREQGRLPEAVLIFEEIIIKYPNSELVAPAWGLKGDCQFTLGAEDPRRYAEALESYRVVARSSAAGIDLVLQAEYKIGRCLEKMGRTAEAFEQYYLNVILRYFEDREKGVWHNESAKVWFAKAASNAADIMEAGKDWRKVVSILERVVQAGVPGSSEAKTRIEAIRTEQAWLF